MKNEVIFQKLDVATLSDCPPAGVEGEGGTGEAGSDLWGK